MYGMKLFAWNSDTTTKWPTPNIEHYIGNRERFWTRLSITGSLDYFLFPGSCFLGYCVLICFHGV